MFPLGFGNEIRDVTKIKAVEFSALHKETILQIHYQDHTLVFPEGCRWISRFLGAGEEKAVFCVCDEHNRVFALELINQKTYLDGRFVGGAYFYETLVPGLGNVKFNSKSIVGLVFTGLVKAREYVHGYEWARFQYSPLRPGWPDHFLTAWFQFLFGGDFAEYRAHYKDVHDRNVMFEIRDWKAKGVPALIKDWRDRVRAVKIGVQPIDVR